MKLWYGGTIWKGTRLDGSPHWTLMGKDGKLRHFSQVWNPWPKCFPWYFRNIAFVGRVETITK